MASKVKKRSRKNIVLEKASLLHGEGNWIVPGVKRLGVPSMRLSDGPLGLRLVGNEQGTGLYDSVASTCYPSPALLACSWDTKLEKRIGVALGKECALKDVDMLLSPGVNIKRNPLCGRNFEYFSEDPYLSGKMAAGFITGIQSEGVGACIKHFACNSQESYRNINDSIVDERALNEIYLRPFQIAIEDSDPWAVMCCYNLVNGVHGSDNEYLLIHTLRDEWAYEGVVMSDWGAALDPVYSHAHGLDLEMPCFDKKRTKQIARAVSKKTLPYKRVQESADRVLTMLRKSASAVRHPKWTAAKGHDLAVEAAESSFVLLRNEDDILPLSSYENVCIIGELADKMRYQGNGSSHVRTESMVSFLDVAKAKKIPYCQGYHIDEEDADEEISLRACDLASRSKTVVLFMGLPAIDEGESYDREDMNLPENQIQLFNAISAINPNVIVILSCGAPVVLPFREKAKAILLTYLGGEGVAEAIDHVLTGQVNPSGKLAETWPEHYSDVPSFGFYPGYQTQSVYKESIYVGYRYYLSCEKKVAYPFGYGLSYTKFTYALSLSDEEIRQGDKVKAKVTVKNVGGVLGEAVIELYRRAPQTGNVFRPLRELIAFDKVELDPGEEKEVSFTLSFDDFSHYDAAQGGFSTEGGRYLVEVGTSCEDIVSSEPLEVISSEEFASLRHDCPVYYAVPDDGFVANDDDFEALLGHPIALPSDRQERPFTLESTGEDIEWTWIGKQMKKVYDKMMSANDNDPCAKKMMLCSFKAMPLRGLTMGGLSPNVIQCILDLANAKPFSAIIHLIFGKKNPNETKKKK